jgi:hypothetical protein
MALDYTDRYEGQVVAGDAAYPFGRAKNVLVENDGTGTPLEKDLVNDIWGCLQALLLAASITPSGITDTALASQYKAAIAWIAASANATFDPCHPAFGAVGEIVTELEDDTAALQACFDAAYAAIGGANVTVDLGGRSYRITGALSCYPHVNVRNGKLRLYHASADMLVFETLATQSTVAIWENVDIGHGEANSGIIIENGDTSAGVRVAFNNCHFNSGGLCTGWLLFSPTESDFYFDEKCRGNIPLDNAGFRSDAGELSITGGKYTTPAAYAVGVVQGTGGTHNIRGVDFDMSGSTAGNATAVSVTGALTNVEGCTFRGGNHGNTAIAWTTGAKLTAHDNSFEGVTPYARASGDALLAAGYSVELLKHVAYPIIGTTVTVSAFYAVSAISSTNAAGPGVTLDDPLFLGQEHEVIVYNDHASDAWANAVGFSGDVFYSEAGLATLANNELASIRFRAVTVAGGTYWVQIGTAAQHFVA